MRQSWLNGTLKTIIAKSFDLAKKLVCKIWLITTGQHTVDQFLTIGPKPPFRFQAAIARRS